jgi:hypothetical protein
MRRLIVFGFCAIAVAAAAWLLHSPRPNPFDSPAPLVARTIKTDTLRLLNERAACMYLVLAKMPNVEGAKKGFTNRDGWNYPFVEYLAPDDRGFFPRRFEAQAPRIDHKEYWFLTTFYGPIPPGFDFNLLQLIEKQWKAQCLVETDEEII